MLALAFCSAVRSFSIKSGVVSSSESTKEIYSPVALAMPELRALERPEFF